LLVADKWELDLRRMVVKEERKGEPVPAQEIFR
jgi:hypothetical protein